MEADNVLYVNLSFSHKARIFLVYNPAIELVNTTGLKIYIGTKPCTQMFLTTSFKHPQFW